jgi:hypothetical protein
LLVVFFVIEAKTDAPLLPLPLFRLSSVAGSNAAGFLLGTSLVAVPVAFGPIWRQQKARTVAPARPREFVPSATR